MTFDNNYYDVIVVGAGINGLGIARDAAERGLRTILVEQEDLCSGVSAWSGRLVHGGLRYLEHLDFALVRESLRERERLFSLAPHLVKPVDLIMPFYAKNQRPPWLIWLGMIAYDFLSMDKSVRWHRVMGKRRITERFTGMETSGLSGAALFIDGQVEYAERLCVELALQANRAGCDIVVHRKVTGFVSEKGKISGVTVGGGPSESKISGRVVINAAGPWVDRVNEQLENPPQRLIGGTKGSHIIVGPFEGAPQDVVYYESQADGRLVLVIPWMGRYLIGTTDTKFDDEPDSARADSEEISYLLTEVNTLIPGASLSTSDILYTYSGVRPLPYAPGVAEWKVPRSHVVLDHASDGRPGLYSIIGGKLTTYRQLAEDAVDLVLKRDFGKSIPCRNKNQMFPGAERTDFDEIARELSASSKLGADTVERLLSLYGSRALTVANYVRENPALAERFDPASSAIAAELYLAVEEEFALTLTDIFARRILLAFEPGHGLGGLERAAEIVAPLLAWKAKDKKASIAEYRKWLDHLRVPANAGN